MNTLDISQKELLHILADVDKPVSIEYIQDRLGVSKRTVYSLISKVNESLFLAKIEPISNKRGQGYFLTKQQKESISKTFLNNISLQRLASNERMCYLICWIMYPKEPVHVKDIMELFDISRNSVFNDLKNLKSEIAKYDVELFFDIKGGYEIRGQIFSKRAVFLYYIKQLLQTISYKSLEFLEITETEEFYLRLQQISRDQGNEYDDFNLLSIACLLSVVHYLDEQFDFSVLELKNIEQTEELKLINELFQDLNMYERLYLTIHLLGSKASSVLRVEDDQRDIQLFELAEGLVNLFERNTSCNVSERNELVNSLYMHFKLSMYYFQFSIQITNSLLDDVKRNYGYLFQVIKRLCSLMENSFPFILSDSEISYITMHFGGHLKQVQGKTFGPVNVLVVCPSGISTSTLLKREIEDLYFNVKVVAVTSKANIIEYAEKIDFIISTIDLDTELPWIKVNTILTKEDKGRIASMMALSMQTYQINENNFEDFFAILKKYVEKDRMPGLKKEVYEFLRKGDLLIEVKGKRFIIGRIVRLQLL